MPTNDELVEEYKKNGNEKAHIELLKRFYASSRKEAGALLRSWRDNTNAEFDDLVQIGLMAFETALRAYDFKGGFFTMWQKTARNEMLKEIQAFSYKQNCGGAFLYDRLESSDDCFENVFACDEDVPAYISRVLMISDMEDILMNYEKHNIKAIDVEIFYRYYFEDLSYAQLSEIYGLAYHTVNSKIKRVMNKLKDILSNKSN